MPLDTSIPLQVRQTDPTQQLSSLMGVLSTSQAMQARQQSMQAMEMQNQQAAIDLSERQNIQQVMQQNKGFANPDTGDIDLAAAMPKIMSVAPTKGAEFIQQLATGQAQKVRAQQTIAQQSDENNTRVGNALASLPPDADKNVIDKTFQTIRSMYPNPDMQNVLGRMHDHILGVEDPDQRATLLKQGSRMFLPQAAQQQMNTPEGIGFDNGQYTGSVNIKPGTDIKQGAIIPGTLIQKNIPVTQPIQMRNGASGIYGIGGNAIQTSIAPSDAAAIPQLEAERTSARQSVLSAGTQHNANKEILSALDDATTGQYGGIIAKAKSLGGLVLGSTDAEKSASAYDTIGKMTERNALEAAKSMGPQTNAGLQAQVAANGSPQYNPTALRNITKLNDAIVTGAEHYQPGLEAAIKANGNNVLAKRDYDQAWGQNFDPLIFRLKNAVSNHDQAEIESIQKQLGGKNSEASKALAAKWKNLQSLSTTGQLPQ